MWQTSVSMLLLLVAMVVIVGEGSVHRPVEDAQLGENYDMRHGYLPLHMLSADKNAMNANRVNVTVVAVCRTI